MNNAFKNRPAGFYVGCVSAVIALVTAFYHLGYSNAVGDAYNIVPVILIIGAAISALALLKDIHFLNIVPGVCYISAFALYLSSQMGNISAKLSANGVGNTGTSLSNLIAILVLVLVSTVLAVAACFMKQKKA